MKGEFIASIFDRLKSAATAGLVIGIVVAIINTYVNVRLQTRTAIEADFVQFKSTATDLLDVLSKYAKKANGSNLGPIPDDVQDRLNKDIFTLYKVGGGISSRKPVLKPEFDTYEKHLQDLKTAIDNLKGPASGKEFVETTSSYLAAEEEFRDKVNAEQSGYLNLLSLN